MNRQMNAPAIHNVKWADIERWLRTASADFEFDTIVGVARAGLPIAVTLSYLAPNARLAFLERRGPRGEKPSLYDFSADRVARMEQLDSSFYLSQLEPVTSKVMIVDDVATFGDTLAIAQAKVMQQAPNAQIRFCCYAVDEDRLSQARPGMMASIHHAISIDNSKTWVSFPWTVEP